MRNGLGKPVEHVLAYSEHIDITDFVSHCCRGTHFQERSSHRSGAALTPPTLELNSTGTQRGTCGWQHAETLIMKRPMVAAVPNASHGGPLPEWSILPEVEEGAVPVLLGYSLGKSQGNPLRTRGGGFGADAARVHLDLTEIYRALRPGTGDYVRYAARVSGRCWFIRRARTGHACSQKAPPRRSAHRVGTRSGGHLSIPM
jgi:hypothetical protein